MTITPTFIPGTTIHFVNPITLFADSAAVLDINITVDSLLAVTIKYNCLVNGYTQYINEVNAFATQNDLANSFLLP